MESTGSSIVPDSQESSPSADVDVTSLTPSVTNYPMRWGRRYHKYKEGVYLFPNDEIEANRLDLQHAIIVKLHGGRLFFSPIRNPSHILDIGTGTGIWPIELADSGLVPNARITGIDLSPIQPSDVPEEVSFEVADCTERDWCRPLDSLDLVHIRMMLSSLNSFYDLMVTARRYIRPGNGWIECHELDPRPRSDDDTIPTTWPVKEWEKMIQKGTRNFDASRSLHIAPKLKKWMEDAGYVDVQEVVYKLPIGAWPKDKELKKLGRAFAQTLCDGLSGFSYKIMGQEGLGMSRTEIEVYLTDVRKSLNDRSVHSYFNMYTVFGRRPSLVEEEALKLSMRPPPRPGK